MKYLYFFEDGTTKVIESYSDDELECVENGTLRLFKFEAGTFWELYVEKEEIEDERDLGIELTPKVEYECLWKKVLED
jgi:hypothetical protein